MALKTSYVGALQMESQSFHLKVHFNKWGTKQILAKQQGHKKRNPEKQVCHKTITQDLAWLGPETFRIRGVGVREEVKDEGRESLPRNLGYAASDLIEMEILGLKTP